MTVKQLIEMLNKIEDQEVRVMVRGYEGGYNDAQYNLTIVDMALNVNSEWYYGAHEKISDVYHEDREKYEVVKVIVL